MTYFITIYSTVIHSAIELDLISNILSKVGTITEWTHDLEDDDEILRVVSNEDISEKLIRSLTDAKIEISLMAIFKTITNGTAKTNRKIFSIEN